MVKRPLVWLFVILVFAAAIRVYLFRGYIGLDDGEYAFLAHQVAERTFVRAEYAGPAVFPMRVGIIAPAALLFKTAGVNEWTLAAYPLLLSLAGIIVAYLCASVFFGRRAGLIAAALLALMPAAIEQSTSLLPDFPSAVYEAAGVTLIAVLLGRAKLRRAALFAGGALAGIGFGAAWLSKESIVFLVPFCAIWLVTSVWNDRARAAWVWGGVAAGALAVLSTEILVYHQITGDWLFRLHETERNYRQNAKWFFSEGSSFGWRPGGYGSALRERLFVTGPTLILFTRKFMFLPLVGLVAAGIALLRRDRSFLIPGLWLLTVALMFNFSTSSLRSYVPLALTSRYLDSLLIPATVLVSGLLARALFSQSAGRVERTGQALRFATAAVALILVGMSSVDLLRAIKYPRTWMTEIRDVSHIIAPARPVYADTLTLRAFEFLSGYPAETKWVDFNNLSSGGAIPAGSVIIVNRPAIQWLEAHGGIWDTATSGYRQHSFYEKPPARWTLVRRTPELNAYVVANVTADTGH